VADLVWGSNFFRFNKASVGCVAHGCVTNYIPKCPTVLPVVSRRETGGTLYLGLGSLVGAEAKLGVFDKK